MGRLAGPAKLDPKWPVLITLHSDNDRTSYIFLPLSLFPEKNREKKNRETTVSRVLFSPNKRREDAALLTLHWKPYSPRNVIPITPVVPETVDVSRRTLNPEDIL